MSRRSDAAAGRPLRVLLVDDSAAARHRLGGIIEADRRLEVMASAPDPFVAAERLRRETPDVILLDLEMPRMDGLTFLRKLMAQRPIPVVVCSALTETGSRKSMEALESGAVDVIAKPQVSDPAAIAEAGARICDALHAAAHARLRGRAGGGAVRPATPVPRRSADVVIPPRAASRAAALAPTAPLICVGASTGGTEALKVLLGALPANAPGVAVVQHMPPGFTAAFARRLDGLCAVEVREAQGGETLRPGLALIAPGDRHLAIRRRGAAYVSELIDGPLVSRHRPSVDVLFRSAAQQAGAGAVGVIMTGMGDDGARGMAEMRAVGAATLAQDEASCVVYGMPKEAVAHGGVERSAPLEELARLAVAAAGETGRKA